MMQRYGKGFILCCLLACMNSCSDVTLSAKLNENESVCQNNVLYTQGDNDDGISTQYCSECINNRCRQCTDKEGKCQNDDKNIGHVIKCDINGQYDEDNIETCNASCNSEHNNCGKCINGEIKCSDGKYTICSDGIMGEAKQCTYNKCQLNEDGKSVCLKCEKNRCTGVSEVQYCVDGEWKDYSEPCGDNKVCVDGECKSQCPEIGLEQCIGKEFYTCNGDYWDKSNKSCPDDEICINNKECGCESTEDKTINGEVKRCIDNKWTTIQTPACQADQTKCENDKEYKCIDNEWTEPKDCDNGCNQNTNKCNEGIDCQGKSLLCYNNLIYRCDNNNPQLVQGCADNETCVDEDEDAKCIKTSSDKCTADVCKDANTLTKCNEDGSTTDEPCANGCDAATNKCKDAATDPGAKCTADKCDGNNLMVCDKTTGIATAKACANGCDATKNECLKCTEDKCDGNNLMVCNKTTGVATAKACANGCDSAANKCKDAQTPSDKCTADVCKDANTLTKCNEDGSTTDENCANGCDSAANKCKDAQTPSDKCTADVCKDENTLVKCSQDGSTTEETCPNGCDDNAKKCKDSSQCSQGDKKCGLDEQNNSFILQCNDKGQWGIITPCPNGCDETNIECKESPVEPPTNCNCNDNDIITLICEGENVKELYYCYDSCDNNNKCSSKAPGFYHDGQNKVYKCTEEHGCYFIPTENSDNNADKVTSVCADDNYVYTYDTITERWNKTECNCPEPNQISTCNQHGKIRICEDGSTEPVTYTCENNSCSGNKCEGKPEEEDTTCDDKEGIGIRCTKEYGCYRCHNGEGEETSCNGDKKCGVCKNGESKCVNDSQLSVCENGEWVPYP